MTRAIAHSHVSERAMTLQAPDWLTQRGGDLKRGSDGVTWYVYFGADPEYALRAVPVGQKFGCTIRQTINGKRLDNAEVYSGPEEAIRGGLEQLRKLLGW